MTQIERRRALAESLQNAIDHPMRRSTDIKQENETGRHEARQRRRRVVAILFLVAWGSLGWLWLARPDAVFNPPLGQAEGAEYSAEAGLRYGMFLQAARIREFEADSGRLPQTIAEAGEAEEGLTYSLTGGRWTLRGTVNGTVLELTSEMSADAFLQAGGAR